MRTLHVAYILPLLNHVVQSSHLRKVNAYDSVCIEYLVVGGGGPGFWGGGGAGGFLTNLGTCYTLELGSTIPITVGYGGWQDSFMHNGGDSTFGTVTALGGGAGFEWTGFNGGSGGGGGSGYPGGSATPGQGNNGGGDSYYTSGGGGAGQPGTSVSAGNGLESCIASNAAPNTGLCPIYAGGGGGWGGGSGGTGGGGTGTRPGAANTGSGGGGEYGPGGSGIVILRHLSSLPLTIVISGLTVSSETVIAYTGISYKVYKITSGSGSVSFTALSGVHISNPDFEVDSISNGGYQYLNPSYWTGSGAIVLISAGDGAWGGGIPPSGTQYIGIQSHESVASSITQDIGFSPNGFTLTFYARARPSGCNDDGLWLGHCLCNVALQVSYCETVYFAQSMSKLWTQYTVPVISKCLSHSNMLAFKETTINADCTVHIDAITLTELTYSPTVIPTPAPSLVPNPQPSLKPSVNPTQLAATAPGFPASAPDADPEGKDYTPILIAITCLLCVFLCIIISYCAWKYVHKKRKGDSQQHTPNQSLSQHYEVNGVSPSAPDPPLSKAIPVAIPKEIVSLGIMHNPVLVVDGITVANVQHGMSLVKNSPPNTNTSIPSKV